MVKLKFKSKDEKGIEYYYQPELEGEFGIVSMDFKTQTFEIIKRAEKDSEGSIFYTVHCEARLSAYIDSNDFVEEDIRIWY